MIYSRNILKRCLRFNGHGHSASKNRGRESSTNPLSASGDKKQGAEMKNDGIQSYRFTLWAF